MALLIGNPVCCCALGCGTAPTEVASQCCSGGTPVDDGSDQDDRQKRKGCDCCFDKISAENFSNKVLPPANPDDLLGGPLAPTDAEVSLPRIPLAVQCISKWPPGELPGISMGERLARKCSYLL